MSNEREKKKYLVNELANITLFNHCFTLKKTDSDITLSFPSCTVLLKCVKYI